MNELTEKELALVNSLATSFYDIVPPEMATYCLATSRIAKAVLAHFGIEAELRLCQVWLATPDNNFVVGFLGREPKTAKWDGHVVCQVGSLIVDAALQHFHVQFGQTVPRVVVVPRFIAPTQVISRLDLNERNSLWWHCPPASAGADDLKLPDEPQEPISRYSAQLIKHLSTLNAAAPKTQSFDCMLGSAEISA